MNKKQTIINHTSQEHLENIYNAHNGTLPIRLEKTLNNDDLLDIINTHEGTVYFECLLQLLVTHPAADNLVIAAVLEKTSESGVLNAIATSPQTSATMARKLLKSKDPSVRDHARLKLITLSLDAATTDQLATLLKKYRGAAGISMGVRQRIVEHPRTPHPILLQLSMDACDFIRKSAKSRLAQEKKKNAPRT